MLFAQPIPTPQMAISWSMKGDPRQWAPQGVKRSPAGFLLQFVPAGDSIAAWNEMIAQQIVFGAPALPVFVKAWKTGLLKADPKTELTETTNPDGSVWLTSTSLANDAICQRRFIQGPDGIYMLAYFVRPRLKNDDTFKAWSEIIGAATLIPSPNIKGNPPLNAKFVGSIPIADGVLHLNDVAFLPRDSHADSHEYTPKGQEDLDHWADMITINYYRKVTDGEGLAAIANAVIQNYKNHQGRILGIHSVPRTPDHPAEHFVATLLGAPGLLEAALVRFKLVEGVGASIVYSHRFYGKDAAAQMGAWLKTNGKTTEDALMSWEPIPALKVAPLMGGK